MRSIGFLGAESDPFYHVNAQKVSLSLHFLLSTFHKIRGARDLLIQPTAFLQGSTDSCTYDHRHLVEVIMRHHWKNGGRRQKTAGEWVCVKQH